MDRRKGFQRIFRVRLLLGLFLLALLFAYITFDLSVNARRKTVIELKPAQNNNDLNVYRVIKTRENKFEIITERVTDPNTNKPLEGSYRFECKCKSNQPTLVGVLFHTAGKSRPTSIGCQTMPPGDYDPLVKGYRVTFVRVLLPGDGPSN